MKTKKNQEKMSVNGIMVNTAIKFLTIMYSEAIPNTSPSEIPNEINSGRNGF